MTVSKQSQDGTAVPCLVTNKVQAAIFWWTPSFYCCSHDVWEFKLSWSPTLIPLFILSWLASTNRHMTTSMASRLPPLSCCSADLTQLSQQLVWLTACLVEGTLMYGILRNVFSFVVCFLLGNYPASEFYMPTFRNTLFHLHKQVDVSRISTHIYLPMKMEQTLFRNVGI